MTNYNYCPWCGFPNDTKYICMANGCEKDMMTIQARLHKWTHADFPISNNSLGFMWLCSGFFFIIVGVYSENDIPFWIGIADMLLGLFIVY